MMRYLDTIMIPFIVEQRKKLLLISSHRIFDGFKGQNTPEFLARLEEKNISCVRIPPNCTDKLQPLDISINKSMKNELRKQFQMYYASEVQRQLSNDIAIERVKVDLTLTAIKTKSASWIMSSWHEIEKRPELAINGFNKAGILNIVNNYS